ncbi:MAG: sulfotransferase [Pseudomonadota bacterium]
MAQPRILFGVGATKAGTGWLHDWLSSHPDCHFRGVKELHYFNTFHDGSVPRRIMSLEDERAAVAARGGASERIMALGDLIDAFRVGGDGAYLRYLSLQRVGEAVVGDVTPAYSLLPVARLQAMAALGDTRFLYVLRDPVARLWSHVRMIAKRRDPNGRVTAERSARILKRTIQGKEEHISVRSDYRSALERLAAAIPEPQRLTVFFEELFSGEGTRRISAFLGIAPHPPLASVIHAGQPLAMTRAQDHAARDFLADQYAYVTEALGPVPQAWQPEKV